MSREPNLEHLTTLLGQCLGRIDERAFQLQRLADDDDGELDIDDVLEQEAATLQELVGSLVDRMDAPESCDVNTIVVRSLDACLHELDTRILARRCLADELPAVGCSPSQLAFAVQRALVIATGRLEAGGEVIVTTRLDGDDVVLELESRGGRRDRHLRERTLTLCEFVASFRGHCHIDLDDRDTLLVVLELPHALSIDER
jgi:hypothetical protein